MELSPRPRIGVDLAVRRCRAADLDVWESASPSQGFNDARFARSERGDSVYLLAWLDGRPVGQAELLLTGCAAAEVRAALGIVPEISGVEVLARYRRLGIATAIVEHTCALAAQRGLPRAGVGFAGAEPGLGAWYRRLGFTGAEVPYVARLEWTDHRDRTNRAGVLHVEADACTFLVKAWA